MQETRGRSTVLFTLGVSMLLVCLTPVAAVVFNVDDTRDLVDADPGDGNCLTADGTCTLRAAIQQTNALTATGTDTVSLPAGVYKLDLAGVVGEDAALSGDLDITDDLDLVGAGPGLTIIDAQGIDRVFDIHNGTSASIESVTIRGGAAVGAVIPNFHGGGIYVRGANLDLADAELTGNLAGSGAGLFCLSSSTVSIADSSIRDNTAAQLGSSQGVGGALETYGSLDLDRVEITGNRAANIRGAVVFSGAPPASIRNSTISGNQQNGLSATNTEIDLLNSTIKGNARYGLSFGSGTGTEPLTVRNTIIASNTLADCGPFLGTPPTNLDFAGEHNLDSDGSCPLDMGIVDLPSTDPMLGPLGLHGGHTRTHVPLVGSPVIDVGNNDRCEVDDQRGAPRPLDGGPASSVTCDIGAVEVLPCEAPHIPDEVLGFWETNAAHLFEACYTIANGDVFRILDGGVVVWKARDLITLGNGFEVMSGGSFEADLDPDAGSFTDVP